MGGIGRAKVKDIHKPRPVWESPGGSPLDHLQVMRWCITAPGNLLQDLRDSVGGTTFKAYKGAPGVGSKPQLLHRRASSACATGHHGGNIDGGGLSYLHSCRTRGCGHS